MEVQLRDLVWDMCRRTQSLPTAAERIALISGRGRLLRDTLPREVRGQGVGGSCVAIVADDERRGVCFQLSLREDVAKFLPGSCGKGRA